MEFHLQGRGHRRSVSEASTMPFVCRECGCSCQGCIGLVSNLDLQAQIEALHSQLQRSQTNLGQVEKELMEGRQTTDYELAKTREELARLRERYDRLMDSHKKMQKLNNNLEDKLLKLVNQFESEKNTLQQELSNMTTRLLDTRVYIAELEEENMHRRYDYFDNNNVIEDGDKFILERYRSDCNMAVQLLQCKPSSFVGQRLNGLPIELQERVRRHMTREQQMQSQKAEEDRLLRVPMPTFPPTAMVFSVDSRHNATGNAMNGNSSGEMKDIVPMSLIAKVLAQGPPKHQPLRTYLCVNCRKDTAVCDKNTQANLLIDQSIVVERVPANCLHHGMAAKLYRTSSLENGS